LKHLNTQLRFLEQSANAYDNGDLEEAKRLALILRILLYDSPNSHSVLSQLGKKDQLFEDSAVNYDSNNILGHGGLVEIVLGPPSPRYIAMLDDVPGNFKKVSFDEWWNSPVFVDKHKQKLSRGQLIGIAADQDGGAHVDPSLDKTYFNISKKGGLGWMKGTNVPIPSPELAAIRQISHEVLKTLVPNYSKKPKLPEGIIVGDVSVTPVHSGRINPVIPIESHKKIGRNEKCPCGSGIKYKKCHGKEK